jgi:hypothetical protein
MNAALPLLALLQAAAPAELSDPAPGVPLRWPALELVEDGSGAASSRLAPTAPLRFSVAGPAIVRLRGTFAEGCEPVPFRSSGDAPAWIDLPLRPVRDGGDLVLQVTPAIAPGLGDETTEKPARFRIELPAGCPATSLSAFRAVAEEDEYRATALTRTLRRWGHERHPLPELKELLARALPHRWQEAAALAAALPALLTSVPGDGGAAEALSHAWIEEAITDAQSDDLSFSFVTPLPSALPRVPVPGSPQPFSRVEAGQVLEAEVRGGKVLRLFSRAPLEALQPVAIHRAEVQFDDRPAVPWQTASSRDPTLANLTRQRGLALPIPPGAERVRVRVATPLLVRGMVVQRKPHLEEVPSLASAAELLARAAATPGTDPRSTLVAVLARAQLGQPESLQQWLRGRTLPGAPGAIAALVAAELSKDETVAAGLLARAETALASATGELDRLARPLLRARILRARMRGLVASSRSSEAVRGWLELAAERPITSEDAVALAEADAFASEGLEAGAPVLAVLDGLAASRPLDREVLVARARAYALATGWYSLGAIERTREATFLELPPESRVETPPQPHPVAPERFAFARVPPAGEALAIDVPRSSLPGRRPVLSLVVARGAALARLVTVRLDGVSVALPALSPFERFDLPVAPGRHRVVLESTDFAGEVLVNYAIAPESRFLHRYAELGARALEWRSREIGSPAVARVGLRLVGASGAASPGPIVVTLEGVGPQPLKLRVHPGPWRTDPRGDLAGGRVVTEAMEIVLPVTRANVFRLSATLPAGTRLLARMALRRHRPVVPAAVDPDAVTGAGVVLADAGGAIGALATLSARLAAGRPDPVALIARAATLLELDELGLAREDLLAALKDRSIGPHQRALVTELWRSLDAIGSDHPASVPPGVAHLTPSLLLTAGHRDAMSVGLVSLLDDAAALGRLPPVELRRRAGEGAAGDLAVLLAASTAERAGDAARAATLWLDLAAAHPGVAMLRRTAGEALLRSPDPKAAALAYLELSAACELDPRDAYGHRLLRQAAGRTRLRPLRFAEQSAGARGVVVSGGEPLDPSVEEAMLPPSATSRDSFLLTGARQARLALSLNAPVELTLRAHVVELRANERPLLGREAAAVEYVRDGEPPVRLACGADGTCRSKPVRLRPGMHVLDVRLVGGLRPAGRLWADAERRRPLGRARPTEHVAASHVSEFLVATAREPVELVVHGPALLRVEARSPVGRRLAPEAELTARIKGQAPLTRTLALPADADPRASLEEGGPLTRASVTTLALPAPAIYRVSLRPSSGELLARIAARDAGATQAVEPPPTLVYRSLTPRPATPVPNVQEPLPSHLAEIGAAPGLDWLGSVEVASRWSYEQYDPSGAEVQRNSAVTTGFAYRRLLDAGWLTLKLTGGVRSPTRGQVGEWLGGEAFVMHPELRSLRAQLTLTGNTQQIPQAPPYGDARAWAGVLGAMVEPVLTLTSGLHLVSKVGARLSHRNLRPPPDEMLPLIDPAVYSRYAAAHDRALFLEEGLEAEPLANVVLYANGRVTTNRSLRPNDPDHLSAAVLARTLIGRTYAEASFRATRFLPDTYQRTATWHPTAALSFSQTLWMGPRHHVELGVSAAYHIHGGVPEFSTFLAWEGSNGRRFRDHTPLEGEDYFFPQRGPGVESGRLEAR